MANFPSRPCYVASCNGDMLSCKFSSAFAENLEYAPLLSSVAFRVIRLHHNGWAISKYFTDDISYSLHDDITKYRDIKDQE